MSGINQATLFMLEINFLRYNARLESPHISSDKIKAILCFFTKCLMVGHKVI
jgi:hypothetical protein